MKKDSTEVHTLLFTEKQAARYLTRSASSLRRGRKNGTGPKFLRIGRSIRYLQCELDGYLFACRRAGNAGVVGG
jgi:hypothetical protein